MIVFRLSKSKFANDLSGKGAEKSGGRWNSKGTALVYTSASRALCTTEIAVHTPLGNLPLDYELISIEIPDEMQIQELTKEQLPPDWKSLPHSHATQEIGDRFVAEGIFPVLKVPSVVVQDEFNYLINPAHADSHKITIKAIEPFNFDERLFNK
ncbi:MAG: RES family NAD+ phosphorylase [Bacteroidales bacterium]|nr:RES family NAD+ phosphorylase [Bacteroidales bacterium]